MMLFSGEQCRQRPGSARRCWSDGVLARLAGHRAFPQNSNPEPVSEKVENWNSPRRLAVDSGAQRPRPHLCRETREVSKPTCILSALSEVVCFSTSGRWVRERKKQDMGAWEVPNFIFLIKIWELFVKNLLRGEHTEHQKANACRYRNLSI